LTGTFFMQLIWCVSDDLSRSDLPRSDSPLTSVRQSFCCRYKIDYSQSDPSVVINYFAINETNGGIKLIRSLEHDTLRTSVYKLRVIAEDQGIIVTPCTGKLKWN